jgi:hypothetical protein
MKRKDGDSYYISRAKRLLADFDNISRVTRGVLEEHRDAAFAGNAVGRARAQFADALRTLPYIGGDANFLTADLIEAAVILAWYKALSAEGMGAKEIGRIVHETIRRRVRRYPRPVLRLVGRLKESRWFMRRRARQAARSQERRYPGDWVFRFVPGDGNDLLYGLDFTECAICTLYRAHGAEAAVPINCAVDFIMADAFGMRLRRTKSLGYGDDGCNFRYLKKRDKRD